MRKVTAAIRRQGLRALFLFVLIALASCSPGPGQPLASFGGPTMGTLWRVTVGAVPEGASLEELRAGVEAVLDEVNQQMSTYIPDSDISRFNQAEAGSWQVVPAGFTEVLEAALDLAQQSGGAFDPTVGPLVNLWGFGPDGRRDSEPEPASIEQARARVGWQRVKWDAGQRAVQQPGALYLDFSAIAKGYAVDRVGEYLTRQGVAAWLVDIGGDLRTRGRKPDGSAWRIAIERPIEGERSINTVVQLHDLAMATSGDYRNFFQRDGLRYSHTIDPRTAQPVTHQLASVTVLHDSAMQADGLATLLTVLGPEEGMAFAREHHLAVFFIVRADDGFREIMTDGFRLLMEQTN